MAVLRRLMTDQDFEDAIERESRIRVFQDNLIIDDKAIVIRFDDSKIVTQASVGDITYHSRKSCEFFVLKKQ